MSEKFQRLEEGRPRGAGRPAIDDLCRAYRNEDRHTRHVTDLALRIFDGTRAWLNLRRSDRALLEAAGRLHDIGYASDPLDHVNAGVDIVLRTGLRGFTPERLEQVAGIMLLHSSRLEALAGHAHFARVKDPERVHRLGAILRVADALDHGHLQDARITRIRREEGMIRLAFQCAPFTGTVERAMAKSDLWQRVFPLGLVFHPLPRRGFRLLRETDGALDGLRKLLLVQHRVLRDSVRRAARSEDEEALHDLRIALRCVRLLLDDFARRLRKTSAPRAGRKLRRLAKALGPARDLDVWLDLLARPKVARKAGAEPGWAAFVANQARTRAKAQRDVQALLRAGRTRKTLALLGFLLRIELHERAGSVGRPFAPVARRQLKKSFEAVQAKRKLARSSRPEDLHALRIVVRKTRLLATQLASMLGADGAGLVRHLHPVERRLGRIHDLDVALARVRAMGDRCPDALRRVLKKRRGKQVRRFAEEWKGLMPAAARAQCARAWDGAAARTAGHRS